MSRKVDPNNLQDGDVEYLRDRGRLHEIEDYVEPEPEQDDSTEDDDEGEFSYEDLTVDQLKEEIALRNSEYDEDEQIVPDGTKKAELIAALEADDDSNEDED